MSGMTLNDFSNKSEAQNLEAPERTTDGYTTYSNRLIRTINQKKPFDASSHLTEKEVADRLLIKKLMRIFLELLDCFSVGPEGNFASPRKWVENTAFAGGIGLMVADFIIKQIVFTSLTATLGAVGSGLTAVSSAFATASCLHGLWKCGKFDKKLDGIMKDETAPIEARSKELLGFLMNEIHVTPEEIESLMEKLDKKKAKGTEEEKFKAFKDEVLNLAHSKISSLRKMVGSKGAKNVIKNAERIFRNLKDPQKNEDAVRDTVELYHNLKGENKKRKKFYTALSITTFATCVTSIITLVLICALASTGVGGVALVLVGVLFNILWVSIGLYFSRDMLRNRLNRNDLIPDLEMIPLKPVEEDSEIEDVAQISEDLEMIPRHRKVYEEFEMAVLNPKKNDAEEAS